MSDVSVAGVNSGVPGLAARFLGILLSTRGTFGAVVARPRWFGMMILVTLTAVICTGSFLSTEIGQTAYLDAAEASGRRTEGELLAVELMLPYLGYLSAAAIFVVMPIAMAVLAGILFTAFNVGMGGEATYPQVLAVVAHSGAVIAVQQLFVMPLNYARESLSSPTNLTVFLPMLEEGTFFARLLGIIDLFYVWWFVVLAIGLALLYRRRTQPIALTLLSIYGVIAIAVAGVLSALGRS